MSQDFIPGGHETLTLDLGGIVNQFDTVLRLDGQGLRGNPVNLERNGLKSSLSSFEVSASWRFASRSRTDVMYFTAKRTGSHVTDRELDIGGQVIPVNFTLTAEAKDHFFLLDYRYSLVKSSELEFAGLFGFYGGTFTFDASATGKEQSQTVEKKASASTIVPLPVIGIAVDWHVKPRWKIAANVEGLKAKNGDVEGLVLVTGANTEYMLVRNVGVGLGYLYSDVGVDVSKDRFEGRLDWKTSSVSGYGVLKF